MTAFSIFPTFFAFAVFIVKSLVFTFMKNVSKTWLFLSLSEELLTFLKKPFFYDEPKALLIKRLSSTEKEEHSKDKLMKVH